MRHIEQLRTVDCRKSKNTLYKFIASCTLEVARNSNLCLLMSHSLKFQDLDGTESPCRKTSEILNLCEAQNYVLMQSAFSSCAKLLWFVLPLANIWNCDNSLHHLAGEGARQINRTLHFQEINCCSTSSKIHLQAHVYPCTTCRR